MYALPKCSIYLCSSAFYEHFFRIPGWYSLSSQSLFFPGTIKNSKTIISQLVIHALQACRIPRNAQLRQGLLKATLYRRTFL